MGNIKEFEQQRWFTLPQGSAQNNFLVVRSYIFPPYKPLLGTEILWNECNSLPICKRNPFFFSNWSKTYENINTYSASKNKSHYVALQTSRCLRDRTLVYKLTIIDLAIDIKYCSKQIIRNWGICNKNMIISKIAVLSSAWRCSS